MSCTPGVTLGTAAPANPGASTVAFNTTATVPSGARIVVMVAGWLNPPAVAAISNVAGGSLTWVEDIDHPNAANGPNMAIYSADCPSGLVSGTTITATYGVSTEDRFIGGFYIQGGISGSDPGTYRGTVDTFDTITDGTGWSTDSMSVSDGSIVIGAEHTGFTSAAATTNTPTGPSVEVHDVTSGGQFDHFTTEYRTISGASSITIAGTVSRTASEFTVVGVEYLSAPTTIPPISIPTQGARW